MKFTSCQFVIFINLMQSHQKIFTITYLTSSNLRTICFESFTQGGISDESVLDTNIQTSVQIKFAK